MSVRVRRRIGNWGVVVLSSISSCGVCIDLGALVHLKLSRQLNQCCNDLVRTVLLPAAQFVEDSLEIMARISFVRARIRCCGWVLVDMLGSVVEYAEQGHNLGWILADILGSVHERRLGARCGP